MIFIVVVIYIFALICLCISHNTLPEYVFYWGFIIYISPVKELLCNCVIIMSVFVLVYCLILYICL